MAKAMTIAFIGAGSMGGAIARGLVERGAIAPASLAIADPSQDVRKSFSELSCACFEHADELLAAFNPNLVVLAVKPQLLTSVIQPIAQELSGRLVVSIAAGVTLESLYTLVGHERMVRAMPNLPMQVGEGACALTAGSGATQEDVELVRSLFSVLGETRIMRENQLDVAGVISGSSPAFFALVIDSLSARAIEAGMTADDARAMALATMKGTATQLIDEAQHPRVYMERVTSPGGTTAAALRAMEGRLKEDIAVGVDAALLRTQELAKG